MRSSVQLLGPVPRYSLNRSEAIQKEADMKRLILPVITGALLLAALGVASGAAGGRAVNAPVPASSQESQECPKHARKLPADALAPATLAALEEAPEIYGEDTTEGMKATKTARAPFDSERGPQAKEECGKKAWRRTVVVYLHFPAIEPSASLSQGVLFVSRFDDGYKVWRVVH